MIRSWDSMSVDELVEVLLGCESLPSEFVGRDLTPVPERANVTFRVRQIGGSFFESEK